MLKNLKALKVLEVAEEKIKVEEEIKTPKEKEVSKNVHSQRGLVNVLEKEEVKKGTVSFS
jgi:hypothetical protein